MTVSAIPPLLLALIVVLIITATLVVMFVWPIIDTERIGRRADQARWEAEIEARADREHTLWMSGNPQGLHGQFPPADL